WSKGVVSTSLLTTRAPGGASASKSPASIAAIACGSSTDVGASGGASRSLGVVGPLGPVDVGPVGSAVGPVGGDVTLTGGALVDAVGPVAAPGSSDPHAARSHATARNITTGRARRTATRVDAVSMRPV